MGSNRNELGAKILSIRRAHRLSGWHFALKLGVSIDTVRSWEIGRARPSMENLLKLIEAAPPRMRLGLLKELGITPKRLRAWLRE